MSDYMFILESHLTAEQSRVVAAMQEAAADAGMNLFLTGGAMRDMLGGFPIRDLDFVVEGNALKLARNVAEKLGGQITSSDETRKQAELLFPGSVRASVAMAKEERPARPGARAQVTPSTIHGDLRCRDFTINAIALSLNRPSRGLLLDPNNGLADLQHKELRAITNYSLYDDPIRIFRLLRLQVRLGFSLDEKTRQQYANARAAQIESYIGARALFGELRQIAEEPDPAELLKVLDQENLTRLFCPALTGTKLNLAGLGKLQRAKQLIPFGADLRLDNLGLFLSVLGEKLTPKERATLIKATQMRKSEVELWQKLEPRAKKLERELKSAKLTKPSHIYTVLSKAPGDEILFLLLRSPLRLVHDRIRNYLQKYLVAAMEVTERTVAATGVEPHTPKFYKAREEMIAARLDGRAKKVLAAPAPPPQTQAAPHMRPS